MIARVRGVIRAATSSGSRLSVSGSISAKTGVAPRRATASAVAKKVNAGQMTSSPAPMPIASITSTSASVPLATPIVSGTFQVGGGLLLEGTAVGPEHEPPVVQHVCEGLLELGNQRCVLRPDVNERNLRHAETW